MQVDPIIAIVFTAAIVFLIWFVRRMQQTAYSPPVLPSPVPADHPATVVRVYRAREQHDAVRLMEAEAREFSAAGYRIAAQSWAQGSWGCGAFLAAVVLMIVLVGLLVFIYMLLVKPDGSLTVTYELGGAPPSSVPVEPSVGDRLKELSELRDRGVLTPDEYEAKRAALVERL